MDNPSNRKKQALCPVAKKCGGCRYTDTPYKEQLKIKQKRAEQLIKEFGKVKPILGMDEPAHY